MTRPHVAAFPRHVERLRAAVVAASLALASPAAVGAQTGREVKTFVSYSINASEKQVKRALAAGEDFRKTAPAMFLLGGITRPVAVVYDSTTEDWILVGERDPKSGILTLDDWVVALRARFLHSDRDPGCTIDPRGSADTATMQEVRFFGGIERTHFGEVCFEADWLMKRIGLGLERVPVAGLSTYYDLAVERTRVASKSNTSVTSRFWFYPIMSRVNVVGGVVLLERFQMGVFTEVLAASNDGVTISDLSSYSDHPSEAFARSFSDNYTAIADAREVLRTLEGLTRLAALAKGLTATDRRPTFDYWLREYPVASGETPELRGVEVLSSQGGERRLRVSGGVTLAALAMRLLDGDASAFRDLVLATRTDAGATSWEFRLELQDGTPVGVRLPDSLADPGQIGPLWVQALFLHQKKRYVEAIALYSQIVRLLPDWDMAYLGRGIAHGLEGMYARAITDFDRALAINSRLELAYVSRGAAHASMGTYDKAIPDFGKALAINPGLASAYIKRGYIYTLTGDYDQATLDLHMAVKINPSSAAAYFARGFLSFKRRDYDRAIADFTRAIFADRNDFEAYLYRGVAYMEKEYFDAAIADFTSALTINPGHAGAYFSRGSAYVSRGSYTAAITDLSKAMEIDPKLESVVAPLKKAIVRLNKLEMQPR
jgi:tetratricopeptide (TPR) repeat protein